MATLKSNPWSHQRRAADWLRGREYAALFMEMRTGKSRVILDDFMHEVESGTVTALVVIAPNGVHLNWTTRELEAHWPDDVRIVARAYAKTESKIGKQRLHDFMVSDATKLLAFNFEALRSKDAQAYLSKSPTQGG